MQWNFYRVFHYRPPAIIKIPDFYLRLSVIHHLSKAVCFSCKSESRLEERRWSAANLTQQHRDTTTSEIKTGGRINSRVNQPGSVVPSSDRSRTGNLDTNANATDRGSRLRGTRNSFALRERARGTAPRMYARRTAWSLPNL